MEDDATAQGADLLREFGLDAMDEDDDVPELAPKFNPRISSSTSAAVSALLASNRGSAAGGSAAAAAGAGGTAAGAASAAAPELSSDDDPLDASSTSADAELMRAWLNEKSSPDVLPFREDLVDYLMKQVQRQKERVDHESAQDPANAFVANLFYMEIERIKYTLRSYLKSRLAKVERFAQYIVESDELKARLSEDELAYAEQYKALLEKHMMASGLRDLPEVLSRIDSPEMVPKPRLGGFVLCRVRKPIQGFFLATTKVPIDLEEGDVYALHYDDIAPLVGRGDVVLL